MEQFFTDDDLVGLFDELEGQEEIEEAEGMTEEMNASNRRFEEIIKKHRMDK